MIPIIQIDGTHIRLARPCPWRHGTRLRAFGPDGRPRCGTAIIRRMNEAGDRLATDDQPWDCLIVAIAVGDVLDLDPPTFEEEVRARLAKIEATLAALMRLP